MVGVVAHQRGQIEGHGKPGLPLREQIAKAAIGILGRAEARELAHGPQPAAIHRGVNAARVRRLAGIAEIALGIPIREVGLGVEPPNRIARDGGEFRRALRRFLECGPQRVFFPLALGRGMVFFPRERRTLD